MTRKHWSSAQIERFVAEYKKARDTGLSKAPARVLAQVRSAVPPELRYTESTLRQSSGLPAPIRAALAAADEAPALPPTPPPAAPDPEAELAARLLGVIREVVRAELATARRFWPLELGPSEGPTGVSVPRHDDKIDAARIAAMLRPPRVVVVGLRGVQADVARMKLPGVALEGYNPHEHRNAVIAAAARSAELCVVMTKFVGHSAETAVRQATDRFRRVNGGVSELVRCVEVWQKERGATA